MAKWFAVICLKDQLNADGSIGYAAGVVCSYGTDVASAAILASKGLKAVEIGDYGAPGPNFSQERFNPLTEKMESILADVADEASEDAVLRQAAEILHRRGF